jgi:hypothetical protein
VGVGHRQRADAVARRLRRAVRGVADQGRLHRHEQSEGGSLTEEPIEDVSRSLGPVCLMSAFEIVRGLVWMA